MNSLKRIHLSLAEKLMAEEIGADTKSIDDLERKSRAANRKEVRSLSESHSVVINVRYIDQSEEWSYVKFITGQRS